MRSTITSSVKVSSSMRWAISCGRGRGAALRFDRRRRMMSEAQRTNVMIVRVPREAPSAIAKDRDFLFIFVVALGDGERNEDDWSGEEREYKGTDRVWMRD